MNTLLGPQIIDLFMTTALFGFSMALLPKA